MGNLISYALRKISYLVYKHFYNHRVYSVTH